MRYTVFTAEILVIFDPGNFVIENQKAGTTPEARTGKPIETQLERDARFRRLNNLGLNCVFVVVHLRADVDQHEL